ncbi:hypothetical protein NOK91_25545 [Vibrio parahaemolyticus]|uniref:hypothetical protein n=1 Tax=Vibrio parahaemolyticus TaxID=670 RepID=UPI00226B558E|nr:hypothetical protein [Vibrio parahaemolyticus]MCX8890505.1 hypothetical protein [Vibrio parahaemolyticus]
MGNISVDIFPPSYWQDFEKLTLDIHKIKWNDEWAYSHGRQGQSQGGVDVVGYDSKMKEHVGIQCKKRTWKTKPSHESPCNSLTTGEIDEELALVLNSKHNLDRFVIATTGPRDEKLQLHVSAINRTRKDLKVSILFWENYVDFLNENKSLMYKYYEDVLKYRNQYDPIQHYLNLLSTAFDRPAMRTKFHCENRATDFIKALSDTQSSISTGMLLSRDNNVVDQARVPKPKLKGLQKISNKLQKCRDIATKALVDNIIVEHSSCIEIRDMEICHELNTLRFEAIELLNVLLLEHSLSSIDFKDY